MHQQSTVARGHQQKHRPVAQAFGTHAPSFHHLDHDVVFVHDVDQFMSGSSYHGHVPTMTHGRHTLA